jgi:pimeloyl-ACP methyl ester carboxylesterase
MIVHVHRGRSISILTTHPAGGHVAAVLRAGIPAARAAAAGVLAAGVFARGAGAAPKPPEPSRVELRAADGVRLAAFWLDCHEPGAPAVLLLHNGGTDHHGFRPLWLKLQRKGYNVLALDLRGHGASRRLTPELHDRLVLRDMRVYADMVLDAEAGIKFLNDEQKIPPQQIAVVGAELGASIGFQVMRRNARLRGMVALSPASTAYGFATLEDARHYGKRPLFVITTKRLLEDGPQQILAALKDNPEAHMDVHPGAEVRGVLLLGLPNNVEGAIVLWLDKVFGRG